MKLAFRQIEPFIQNPDKKARAILVYGPEAGLMKERVAQMARSVVADLNDPFNAVTLTGDQIAADPARLLDEANAMSLMGGARLIRIEDGDDRLAPLFKDYLQNPSPANLIIVEAAELGPKSPLRALFEKLDNAAAIPCYIEEERDVAGLIRQIAQNAGFQIANDAALFLAGALLGDRQRIRAEMEKLTIYMGSANQTITLEDAQACCGDTGTRSMDDLVYAVAGGNPRQVTPLYEKLLSEGTAPVAMLRALQTHFRKLHLTQSRVRQGKTVEEAMKSLHPPIFFKQEAAFRAQLQKWRNDRLSATLQTLADLEARTKQTGAPVETLCSQAFLSLALRA